MQSFREFVGQELTWTPKSWTSRHHEIGVGNTVLATLDSSHRRRPTATVAEGSVFITAKGIFRQRISVHAEEAGPALITYTGGLGVNALPCTDGSTLKWTSPIAWGRGGGWKDMSGVRLIKFRGQSITIDTQAAMMPDLPLLVVLGLYMTLVAGEAATTAM